jgi:regulatory protein
MSSSNLEVEADSYSTAMTIALHALAPRARSRAELRAHLIKRNTEAEIADAVLDHLELQGLLNDLEFARLWSESRQRQKKLSKRIIGQELRTKGVSQDIIDEVISDIDDDAQYQLAFQIAERKYRSCSHLEPEKIYGRISGALARKGFGGSMASRIIRELMGADN